MSEDSLFGAMSYEEFVKRSGGEFFTIKLPIDKKTPPKTKENTKKITELAAKAGWLASLILADPTSSKALKKEARSFIKHVDKMHKIAEKVVENDPGTQEAYQRKLNRASKSFLEGEEIEE